MTVRPDALPYVGGDGPVGVLLCHGFTGSPASLRPWAEYLQAQGLRVSLPRLPGHGTSWQEMNHTGWPDWYAAVDRAFRGLRRECETVFVVGLSMGGGLALALAEEHGDAVAGLVLVNPSVTSADKAMRLVPLLRRVKSSIAAIGSDVAKPGVDEGGYDATPLLAVVSLMDFWLHVSAGLPQVDQPLLIFRSVTDHVVDPSSAAAILARVSGSDVEERLLHRSYHVATLDYDADEIFAGSAAFIRRILAERADETATLADHPAGRTDEAAAS